MLKKSTTIRQIGSSNGVILDKAMCNALGISLGSPITITVDGSCMTLIPEPETKKPRIGIAAGKQLVPDTWFTDDIDNEIANMMGAM